MSGLSLFTKLLLIMKYLYRFFILGAIATLLAGCKGSTQTELNGGNGQSNGPGYLYAGMFFDGIFRSTDNGLDWARMNTGLTSDSIITLASNGTSLFAGTYGEGIFRSKDNGQSWNQVNSGLSNHQIGSILTMGPNMFAGAYSDIHQGCVFISTDSGENWVQSAFASSDVRTMAAMGQFLFAASTGGDGVFRSSDAGASWSPMNNGISGLPIYVLLAVGTTIFAGTSDALFLSRDSGLSWQSTSVQGPVWSFFGNGNYLLAGMAQGGIFRSTDNGNNWVQTNIPVSTPVDGFVTDGVNVFVGLGRSGVFVSKDNGVNWIASNTGIENEYVRTIAIH
jgi:photosystem II stability/assembly factor-like uncharacterized protein